MPIPNGFTALTATRIQDALGNLLTGLLLVTATDANDVPLAAVAGGAGGAIVTAAEAPFTNGVLAPNTWVPDSALTTNPNTSYRFTFLRPDGSIWRIWRGVQPTGATYNLDIARPNVAPQAVLQYGPAGTIAIRNVTAATVPAIYNVGTPQNAILDIALPQGAQGTPGAQGPAGANSQVGSLSGTFARQAYAADGATAAFLLPVAGLPLVFRNGILQEPGTDYTQSGTTVTFTFTPPARDRITLVVFPAS